MANERTGVIVFKRNPMTLVGPEVRVGDRAPDFALAANDLSTVSLKDSAGKVRLISVVPSLDTPVCDQQTRRFNQEAGALGPNVAILTVSMDLPFAQKRWCGAAGVERVQTLSDYKTHEFGKAYGVRIKELGLLARSVFVVDKHDRVTYVEIVREVADHPNYEKAIAAAKKAL